MLRYFQWRLSSKFAKIKLFDMYRKKNKFRCCYLRVYINYFRPKLQRDKIYYIL